ncbi:MAG: oxidoreductase [Roseibaca calidilacus]|uniref:Oxidoreductase n=1 Tax=Roseibaca calidilacus TaxID=1666912 RepID=A0A0P7X286_9RHOB|nr:Gfo/Idh/MocA family oxidoreductase [Roseibaca calidilacus]KPP94566.1 MAG: oxidoreductase [Roseibaca calidilacus]CUX83241.1 Predicted dehydrogenase [Roseibaca calidilacus]
MIRVLVVGLGQMGQSHALAYAASPAYQVVGLVNRSDVIPPAALAHLTIERDFDAALARLAPDMVAIATYSDSHADLAIKAMQAGAHVFVEKPLASNVADCARVAQVAADTGRKLMVGHILRHHPTWQALIAEARALRGPYVFRLNLNQRSTGPAWEIHKALMQSTPPIVDCGVHYVDVMCQITDAAPVEVRGMGLRLSDEIAPEMYNYGHFQVLFEDGSCGWYEAGWGPMMSDTAHFVKDVVSPGGAVSLRAPHGVASADVEGHTAADQLIVAPTGQRETRYNFPDSPGHQDLCARQAAAMAGAIADDHDLSRHIADAVRAVAICLAADESVRSGSPVRLKP